MREKSGKRDQVGICGMREKSGKGDKGNYRVGWERNVGRGITKEN